MPGLRIEVTERDRSAFSADLEGGAAELGRQSDGEGPPYHALPLPGGGSRVVFAPLTETDVSRRHLSVTPAGTGRVRVENLSKLLPVGVEGGSPLAPGEGREVGLPVRVRIGIRTIAVSAPSPSLSERLAEMAGPEPPLLSLANATLPPGAALGRLSAGGGLALGPGGAPTPDALVRWLQAAVDVLQSAGGTAEFYDKAAGAMVDLVRLDTGVVLLRDSGHWRTIAQRQSAGDGATGRPPSQSVLARVLAERRTFFQVPPSDAIGESLAGVKAVVAAPILDRAGEVIGALYGDRLARGLRGGLPQISPLEAALVELLAGGVASGLARLELERADAARQKRVTQFERELDIGRQIQAGFLPESLPVAPGWGLAAHFRPAREVAGDFYDAFPLSARHIGLAIADVCDKGVGAALFMTLFRSLIRSFATQYLGRQGFALPGAAASATAERRAALVVEMTVLSTIDATNRYVATVHANAFMFATTFFAVLDTATGDLTYANAGHDAPAILGPAGVRLRLETTGPAAGILPDGEFDVRTVRLMPGETLVAHTDGVTDARDPAGKGFGEPRLAALLEIPVSSAGEAVGRVIDAVRAHIGTADQFDDITLLAVRRDAAPEVRP